MLPQLLLENYLTEKLNMINLNIDKNNTIVQTKDKKHSNFDITLLFKNDCTK